MNGNCTSSNCGGTTTCGSTYYCCRTSASSNTYAWQSSSCSIPCDAECSPGTTRSCSLTLTYTYCDNKYCKSKTDTLTCGSQTCGNNYHWGTCSKTANCPSNECADNGDCGLTCGDQGGAQCTSESCDSYCSGCGGAKVCIPAKYTFDCASGYCVACNNETCKCSNTLPDGTPIDDDVDGNANCADPDCAGKTGPGGVTCCQTDGDCPAEDGRKGRCVNYICTWGDCGSNSDCDPGYCCEMAAYAGATKTTTYGCVKSGTIKDNKYLCDPPEWNSNLPQNKNYFSSLMEALTRFLSGLLKL
jgi:hypothetical protein